MLFVMGTAHVALSFAELLQAFVDDEVRSIPNGSIIYWIDVAEPKMQAKEYLQMFSVCRAEFSSEALNAYMAASGSFAELSSDLEGIRYLGRRFQDMYRTGPLKLILIQAARSRAVRSSCSSFKLAPESTTRSKQTLESYILQPMSFNSYSAHS